MTTSRNSEFSIAVLTQRNQPSGRHPAYAALAEAEDVLVQATGSSLIDLTAEVSDLSIRARRFAGAAVRVNGSNMLLPASRVAAARYDVVIAILTSIWELPLLEANPIVRSAGEVAVWIPEVWPSQFDDIRLRREPYGVADHLFLGTSEAPAVFHRVLGRKAHTLTWAADVSRFRPGSAHDPRPVAVLNIGRRIESLHGRLLEWSSSGGSFYEYDTAVGARVVAPGPHRRRLADFYKRSSVAVTSYPKLDVYGEACVSDIPSRLWEGLAAGCVMIGRAPRPSAQISFVGDVVVSELSLSEDEALRQIAELVAEPSTEERVRNMLLAHRKHDWAHRWTELFDQCGWPVPRGLTERVGVLAEWHPGH